MMSLKYEERKSDNKKFSRSDMIINIIGLCTFFILVILELYARFLPSSHFIAKYFSDGYGLLWGALWVIATCVYAVAYSLRKDGK